jgi:hypothetical protein
MFTGLYCIGIGSSGGRLWVRNWTFVFHKSKQRTVLSVLVPWTCKLILLITTWDNKKLTSVTTLNMRDVSKPLAGNCSSETCFTSPFPYTPDSFLYIGYLLLCNVNKCSCLFRRDPKSDESLYSCSQQSNVDDCVNVQTATSRTSSGVYERNVITGCKQRALSLTFFLHAWMRHTVHIYICWLHHAFELIKLRIRCCSRGSVSEEHIMCSSMLVTFIQGVGQPATLE